MEEEISPIDIVRRFCERVGYSGTERDLFREGGHRTRNIERIYKAYRRLSTRGGTW